MTSLGLTVKEKKQYRIPYFVQSSRSIVYTDQHNNFKLSCNSSGNLEMTKTANSCSGVPALTSGSYFYPSENDIMYVQNQTGILMDRTTLSQDVSTLTKTMLSNTSQYFVTNGTKVEGSCNGGFQEVDKNNIPNNNVSADKGGHYYECVNGSWVTRGGCTIKVDYYSPRLYDDVNKSGSIAASKYIKIGDTITCNYDTFGISDPDDGTLKICAINGYRIASDGQTFTVNSVPTNHTFCHKSYIPRDLGAGWNGSVGVDGWCSEWISMDTYKGGGANINDGSSFTINHNDNAGVSATGTLVCNNGTWEIGSGSMMFDYTGSSKTFCVPHGSKSANKSITFELWGGQGGGDNGGNGGYTKGIMSNSYSDGDKYYVVVGGTGNTISGAENGTTKESKNSYNGGGYSKVINANIISGGGGGATHVAISSGVLSNVSSSKILLVAGGGGGGFEDTNNYYADKSGGTGGGGNNSGGNGSTGYDYDYGRGGTTSSGGSGYLATTLTTDISGSFGSGGDCSISVTCTGGGSGYYGGGASGGGHAAGGAGGGSGYCNTSKFTCSGSNGQRSGNGYVKISW